MISIAKQRRLAFTEIVVVMGIISIVTIIGYIIISRTQYQPDGAFISTPTEVRIDGTPSIAAPSPELSPLPSMPMHIPSITSTADLDKATTTLEQTIPDASDNEDAGLLDNEIGGF